MVFSDTSLVIVTIGVNVEVTVGVAAVTTKVPDGCNVDIDSTTEDSEDEATTDDDDAIEDATVAVENPVGGVVVASRPIDDDDDIDETTVKDEYTVCEVGIVSVACAANAADGVKILVVLAIPATMRSAAFALLGAQYVPAATNCSTSQPPLQIAKETSDKHLRSPTVTPLHTATAPVFPAY